MVPEQEISTALLLYGTVAELFSRRQATVVMTAIVAFLLVVIAVMWWIIVRQRQRLQAAAAESGERLQIAMDLIPHIIVAVDESCSIFFANHAARHLFDFSPTPDEPTPLSTLKKFPWLAELIEKYGEVPKADKPCVVNDIELLDTASGVLMQYDLFKTPFEIVTGKRGVLLCLIDNSVLRASEQERLQSEALYRSIFENSEGGIIFASLEDRRIVHANPAFCRMLGYRIDDIKQLRLENIYAENGFQAMQRGFEQLRDNSTATNRFSAVPLLGKDARQVLADITTGVITLNGKKCLVAFFIDVTERQQIEHELIEWKSRLELALNSSRLGMWDWSLNTNEISWNDTMLDIVGVSREEFSGEYGIIREFIHHEDRQKVRSSLSNHLHGKTPLYEVEFRINRQYREMVWLHLVGKVVKCDRNGHPERMIGFVQDITAQKNFEAELRQAKERAEESDRLKSSFLANMSHEIRTPLNAINGFANLINDPELSREKLAEYTQLICKSSDQLLKIISDILDLSKIENRQLVLNNAPLDIRELLHNIYHIFEVRIMQERGERVKLRLNLPSDAPKQIVADESRLTQIFTNLLGNAMKFTEDGYIEFGCHRSSPEIIFYVKDTGTGIPAEKHQLIFEEFVQADNSITKQYGGTGLGLSICRQLVNLMGGRIWVKSVPGAGATFFFSLPEKELNEES